MNEEPKNIREKSHKGRSAVFVLACLVTLIALFYAEEDWRGWHAWQKFKHQWEAKGEKFDFASVVPPPVPDDQNFALTPIVASSYLRVMDKSGHQIQPPNDNVVDRLKMAVVHNDDVVKDGVGNWQKSTVSDLKVWQQYYRAVAAKTNEFSVSAQLQSPADDVLLALSKYDPAIEELRQASELPASRFPLEYDKEDPTGILLPHLAALKRCSQVLQLRAIAELQNGQSDKALDDVKLVLRLTEAIHTEPFLISHLVRIAMLQIMLQPVWEGLAEHRWSEEQLVALDAKLMKLDFLADYKLSMRGEFTHHDVAIENWHRHPEQIFFYSGDNDNGRVMPFPARIAWRLIPNGWFYQNRLRCARMVVEFYIPLADTNQEVISPTATRHADAVVEADTKHRNPYNMIEILLLPALGKATERFAYGQESVDLARVAIALERYRLAHGEYPQSLDVLVPQFIAGLPHDIINGQPLNYRRTADDRFVLYSVGWNETDDDGEVGLKENGSVDINTGDWVWRYPAK
jgi:tetratricopeptide (TPR) repeat protein